MKRFDYLVIGGGIAGLTFALESAAHGTVAVLFKKKLEESSTWWAQGGIAAVDSADDNFELHIQDTIACGAGLCKPEVVEMVVREAPARIHELITWGTKFDRDDASYHLHREGGHSRRRIFHAADATGREIQRALLAAARAHNNIQFFENTSAIDLITTHKLGIKTAGRNRALGAYVLEDSGEIVPYVAGTVLLATGGAGKVYLYTSNPDVATGDGIAMAFRAGAPVANMEFFQFHPTCLFHPKAKSFLITEAMRGEGGILLRLNGEEFMQKYHPLKELAPRDVVARAIDNEMKVHGEDHVLLDMTHKSADFLKAHFPTIAERCLALGIDLTAEPIPVVPAAHYCCGGVVTDVDGQTEIESLYCAGECASTGLHGANRLASNSLLEGVVFGSRAARRAASERTPISNAEIPSWNAGSARSSDEQVVITQNWDEIRRFMWNFVGIVRSDKRLERARSRSELIAHEILDYYWNFAVTADLLELRNLSVVAHLVIESALRRKESRGLHYTIDYPNVDPKFNNDTVIRRSDLGEVI